MSLTRWQPFQEFTLLREAMDRLFDDAFFRPLWVRDGETTLPLDIVERENEFVVRASIPGFDPGQIDVNVQGDLLTIRGTSEEDREAREEGRYYLRERRTGSFHRSVRLPAQIDADKATAEYEHGILTLHLPKVEAAVARKIKVHS